MKTATSIPDAKGVLRRKFKNLRAKLQESSGEAARRQLRVNLDRFLADFQDIQCCLYRHKGAEAPCALEPIGRYFYPVLDGDELEFRKPLADHAFQLNSFAIAEPIPDQSTPLDLLHPALVCCPAVSVDSEGRRLGQGRGYFDRFFARHPSILRIGVVFHVQIAASPLPAESWDQMLDWIVTDKMILRTSTPTRSSQTWI